MVDGVTKKLVKKSFIVLPLASPAQAGVHRATARTQ
jgi:hypothetical protein